LTPEVEAALLWSTPRLRPDELARLRGLLYARLDWNRVMGLMATHRTMGVAWHNVLQHLIEERGVLLTSNHLFKGLEVTYKGQLIMTREQNAFSVELLDALTVEGIPCAMVKGGAVAGMAYPSLGMRVFNDNDLLVEHARLAQVGAVLRALGYEQGSWDYAKGAVRPALRRDILRFPINSHQTHPYMRPTPGARTLECHRLDVHFSVDLMTSNRTDDLVRDLLDRRIQVGEPGMWALHPVDMTIFCCMHFFKEAIAYDEVVRLKDLILYKLVDLLALLGNEDYPVDRDALVARSIAMGVPEQVYYALYYADHLFPGRIPAGLLTALRPASDDYLHQVTDTDGGVCWWESPIAERFFDSQRFAELSGLASGRAEPDMTARGSCGNTAKALK
jgi:hypothetical protein